MNFKKLYLLAWASSCSLMSLEALAQTNSKTAQVLEALQPKTQQEKLTDAQAAQVARYSGAAYDLFLNYWEYIAPVQIQGFTNENGAAQAQEYISEDLFFDHSEGKLSTAHQVTYKHIPLVADEVIAGRLLDMPTQIPMRFNNEVRSFIDYMSVKRRQYALAMLKRKNLYFPLFEKYLKEYGIPDEIKYLAIVESALKPTAVSRAGAGGLWQFMPGTGTLYGLDRNAFVDERMDPEKSTIAACKYLKALNKFFDGDWELALAAYNCGPGRIQKAQRRAGKTGFWEIYEHLPKETRSYVPMFVAVAYTMTYAEDHNIIQNDVIYPIESEIVYINQNISLEALARQINVCEEDLVELNPELRKGVVPASFKNYPLRIPAARLKYFQENQEEILASVQGKKSKYLVSDKDEDSTSEAPSSRNEKTKLTKTLYHTVRRGESLAMISKKYKTTTAQLRQLNGLKNDRIHAGKKIVVKGESVDIPTQEEKVVLASTSPKIVESTSEKKTSPNTTTVSTENMTAADNMVYHTVGRGESLGILAAKYKTTVSEIKKLNGLKSDKIHAGDKIVVKGWKDNSSKTKVETAALSVPKPETKTISPKTNTKSITTKQHTVQNGDSLWKIAQKYGTSVEKIRSENRLSSDKLDVGQTLTISSK